MEEREQKYEKMVVRFSENAKHLLKHKGIRIRDAETEAGVSIGYLSRCMKGGKKISLKTALVLSDMIGESVMDLCTKDHAKEVRELRIQELEEELRRLKGEDEDATV